MPPRSPCLPLRGLVARGLLAVAVAGGGLVLAVPAEGQARPTAAAVSAAAATPLLAAPSPDLPGLPPTAIELARVPVGGSAFDRAAARYSEIDAAHSEARSRRSDLDHTVTVLQMRSRELDTVLGSSLARIAGLTTRLHAVEGAVQELAVGAFVSGGDDERAYAAIAAEKPAISDLEQRDLLGGLSMEVLLTERAAYRARIDEAQQRANRADADLADIRKALRDLGNERPGAVEAEVDAAAAVAAERVVYEKARVLATVEGVEFPLVALDAYFRASETISEDRPRCRVRWWGIAGIARVEGRHGTHGGTALLANGDTTRRIIGIQLNGANDTAVVGDSDGGALDGDPAYDRAIGPMQFIPQTWSRFQADGNDDGTSSPFNMYDATLAAAKYLCYARNGLDGDPGLRAAYFSYNHSVPYVDSVLGYARHYERVLDVPEPARETT